MNFKRKCFHYLFVVVCSIEQGQPADYHKYRTRRCEELEAYSTYPEYRKHSPSNAYSVFTCRPTSHGGLPLISAEREGVLRLNSSAL